MVSVVHIEAYGLFEASEDGTEFASSSAPAAI